MTAMASQITSLAMVYSTVYLGTDQRKHQSSASLAFVWGIHRGPVNSPHKGPVTRKMFPFDDVIMIWHVWNTWLCGCRPQTVVIPLSVKPENGFPPMAQSLWTQYHQRSMLCSSMQNVHWWSLPSHGDVIKWKLFPRYWLLVRGSHRWPVNSPPKASDAELWCFLWSAPE